MRWCANLKPLSHPPGISPDTFSKLYDFNTQKYNYSFIPTNI